MSNNEFFTRKSADKCATMQKNAQNKLAFNLVVDKSVVESDKSCFQASAPFKHNPFKSVPHDVVDIESELRGQTRKMSFCPSVLNKFNKFDPKEIKECESNELVSEYTRINKPCNVLSGITINRFHPLCEDLQELNKIQDNSYIGVNTRLQLKDNYIPPKKN
jgi:hypothetical protein